MPIKPKEYDFSAFDDEEPAQPVKTEKEYDFSAFDDEKKKDGSEKPLDGELKSTTSGTFPMKYQNEPDNLAPETNERVAENAKLPKIDQPITAESVSAIKQALQLQKKEIASVSGSTGGAGVSVSVDPDAQKQANELIDSVNKSGQNANDIIAKYGDYPDQYLSIPGNTLDDLVKLDAQNPERFQRKIANDKLYFGLTSAIDQGIQNGTITKEEGDTEKQFLKAGDQGIDYSQRRTNLVKKLSDIDKYVKDDETKAKLKRYAVANSSINYGSDLIQGKEEYLNSDPNAKFLNKNQLLAYQFLSDTDPENASKYDQVLVPELSVNKSQDAKLGWEEKSKQLEEIGISLQINALKEKVNTAVAKQKNGEQLTSDEVAEANDAINKSEDLVSQLKVLNNKYPLATTYDVDNIAKEITNTQDISGLAYTGMKTAEGVMNIPRALGDFGNWINENVPAISNIGDVQSLLEGKPRWISEEQKKLNQLVTSGENINTESMYYVPQSKQAIQQFGIQLSDDLKAQVDPILANNKLSDEEKRSAVKQLLLDNPNGYAKIPISGGKMNINPSSVFYGVSNLVAAIVPIMGLEILTGGGATASILSKFKTSFTSILAASLHETYQAKVRAGSKNPMGESLIETSISAYTMAGIGTVGKLREVVGTKSAVGRSINNMDDKAIQRIIDKTKESRIYRSTTQLFDKVKQSTKAGAEFEIATGVMRTGQEALNGQTIDPKKEFQQAAVGVLNFTAFGGISGLVSTSVSAFDKRENISAVQAGALLKTVENPASWIAAAKKQFDEGVISASSFNQIKSNIELATEANKDLQYVDDNGNILSENKKGQLLALKIQEAKLNEQKDANIPTKLKAKITEKLTEIKLQIDKVTEPEPKKSSVIGTNPKYEINDVGVTRQELIDYIKNKKYEGTNDVFFVEHDTEMQDLIDTVPGTSEYTYETGDEAKTKSGEAGIISKVEGDKVFVAPKDKVKFDAEGNPIFNETEGEWINKEDLPATEEEVKPLVPKVENKETELKNEEDDKLEKLTDDVYEAQKRISKASDTDAAIAEYNKVKKERDDYEESISKRREGVKKTKRSKENVESLIDSETNEKKRRVERYEYKDLYEKDPRLAALQKAKDMKDWVNSEANKNQYKEKGLTDEQIKKEIEDNNSLYDEDINDLEQDLKDNPVAGEGEVKVDVPEPKEEPIKVNDEEKTLTPKEKNKISTTINELELADDNGNSRHSELVNTIKLLKNQNAIKKLQKSENLTTTELITRLYSDLIAIPKENRTKEHNNFIKKVNEIVSSEQAKTEAELPQQKGEGVGEKTEDTTPKYSRNVSVLITPATIRAFDKLTERMKGLTDAYDSLVNSMDKKPSEKKLAQLKDLENQILEQAKKEIVEAVSKVKGVQVSFGENNMGAWQGKSEPSINMTLKVSADVDTKAMSDIIHDFGERYSQDAIILELDSEHHNDIIAGKTDVKLSERDGKFLYYPKIIINFVSKLNAKQRSALNNAIKKAGITEYTLGNNKIEVSIIRELSKEEENLSPEEQNKLKQDDYRQKTIATNEAVTNSLGNDAVSTVNIRHKKSKYIGGEESGKDGQQRKYDRSDVFKDIAEGLKQTEQSAKELASLRNKEIELQKQGKKLSPEESVRLKELMNSVVPVIEETLQGKEKEFKEAKQEVEGIASKAMKSIAGFVSHFPIKRPSRGAVKVARWYSAITEKLGDAARVNLIVADNASADKVFNKINKEHGNVSDADLRNINESTDLGYPKRLIEIRTSNGTIAEIQVMTPDGYLAKDGVANFPEDQQSFASDKLTQIRNRLGWNIPDGLGHYFYEVNRDFNVPDSLREKAQELSLKYYDAFLNPKSKYTEAQFKSDISDFKKKVDAADKSSWDIGNEGKSPKTLNQFLATETKVNTVANDILSDLGLGDETSFSLGEGKENLTEEEKNQLKKEAEEEKLSVQEKINNAVTEMGNVTVDIPDNIPTTQIPKVPNETRPEGKLMNALRIPLNYIKGKVIGIGMSDWLRTGDQRLETSKGKFENVTEGGGIGYPFKSLLDLINGVFNKTTGKENSIEKIINEFKNKVIYHGKSISKGLGDNTFLSNKKDVSLSYAKREGDKNAEVGKYIPLTKNIKTSDAKTIDEIKSDIKQAKAEGFDGILIENYDDGFDVFDNYVIFDKNKLFKGSNIELANLYHEALKIPEQQRTEQQKQIISSVDEALNKTEPSQDENAGSENPMGWAGTDDQSFIRMVSAAHKANKITGRELKDHYIKSLGLDKANLTAEQQKQKDNIEKQIPDNKKYGLVAIFKMGRQGLHSNEAFPREAFRQIDTKLSDADKKVFFEEFEKRLTTLTLTLDTITINKLKGAKDFNDLENIIKGSGISLDKKSEIMNKVILSTEKTISTEQVNKLAELLKRNGITIESVEKSLTEPQIENIPENQLSILLAIDLDQSIPENILKIYRKTMEEKKNSSTWTPEQRLKKAVTPAEKIELDKFLAISAKRHKNYPFGVEGLPIGVFDETAPLQNISPEIADQYQKSSTSTVDKNATYGKGRVKQKRTVTMFQKSNGLWYAEDGAGTDKKSITNSGELINKYQAKESDLMSASSKEELIEKLKKKNYIISDVAAAEGYAPKPNMAHVNRKIGTSSILSIFKNPKLTKQEKLVKYLQKAFPNVIVEMDKGEYQKMQSGFIESKLFNKNGESYGFVKDGKVYLNPDKINNNVIVHEFSHIWNMIAKVERPELHNKGLELIKDSKYANSIISDARYQKIINGIFGKDVNGQRANIIVKNKDGKFVVNEKDFSAEEVDKVKEYIADESLAKAIGDRGELFINESQRKAFVEWINLLYAALKNILGISKYTPEQLQNLKLNDFLDAVVSDILGNKEISKLSSEDIKALSQGKEGIKFSLDDIEAKLTETIKKQRDKGVSDADIKNALEAIKDKLNIDSDKIDELMGTKPKQAEPKVEPKVEAPQSNRISIAGLSEEFGFSKEFETRDANNVAGSVLNEIHNNATRNKFSTEKQIEYEVNLMKGKSDIAPTEHNIITAGAHLLNINRRLQEAIESNDSDTFDRLLIERDQVATVLRQLGNNAGRNLGLFNLVFKDVTDSEISVAVNSLGKALGVSEVPNSVDALDKSNMPEIYQNKLRPYLEQIDALKEELKKAEAESNSTVNKLNDDQVQAAINDAYEKGRKAGMSMGSGKKEKKSRMLKDLASKLRTSSEMDQFLTGSQGAIQMKGISIAPYKEILASIIEDIATVMDAGEDVAEFIKKAVSKITDPNVDKNKLANDVYTLLYKASIPSMNEIIKRVSKIAKNEKAKSITISMVEKGLISDMIDNGISNGIPQDKIIDNVTAELKKVLPDVTKEDVSDAFVRRNQFKKQSKAKLINNIKEKSDDLKRIAVKEERVKALEAANAYHSAKNKPQKEKIKSDYEKELDERLKKLRLNKLYEEIKYVEENGRVFKKAIKEQKPAAEDLIKARAELEKVYIANGLRIEKEGRSPIAIEQKYQDALKVIDENNLLTSAEKKVKKDELKQQRDLDLQGTKQGVVSNLSDDIENYKSDNIDEANSASIADNSDRENYFNDLNSSLDDILDGLSATGENLDDMLTKAYNKINALLESKKINAEDKAILNRIKTNLENNNQLTADQLASQRLKKQWETEINNSQRKINSNNVTELPVEEFDFRREAALSVLNRKRNNVTGQLKSIVSHAKEKNKSTTDKLFDVSTDLLISGVHTAAKVAEAATLKPFLDALIETTFGRLSSLMTRTSPSTLRSVKEGFKTFAAFKNKETAEREIQKLQDLKIAALKKLEIISQLGKPNLTKQAEDKFKEADLNYAIATLYESIDGNAMTSFWNYLAHGATDYDVKIGKGVKLEMSDYRTALGKIGYVLSGWIRSHSAMKSTISGRPEMMRSFATTLQGMQKEGKPLNAENIALAEVIAANSFEIGRMTNKTGMSKFISQAKSSKYGIIKYPSRFIFPVSTVATNIGKRAIDYSSVGTEGWYQLAKETKKGMKLNEAEGQMYDTWISKMKAGIDRIPLEKRKYINGVIARGLFGASLGAITLWGLSTGNIIYGGTYDDSRKRKIVGSDGKQLAPGEWEFFGWKAPKLFNAFINHTPEILTMSLTANLYQINKLDKGEGKELESQINTASQEIESRFPFMTMGGMFTNPARTLVDRFTKVPLAQEIETHFDESIESREKKTLGQRALFNMGLGFLNAKVGQEMIDKFPDSKGVKFFIKNGMKLPAIENIDKIEVTPDAKHPNGLMTAQDKIDFSKLWFDQVISNMDKVAVAMGDKTLTEDQLKKINSLVQENATNLAHISMQSNGKYTRYLLKGLDAEMFGVEIRSIINSANPDDKLKKK